MGTPMSEATYKIVRFYVMGKMQTIKTGLTLDEAKEHNRRFGNEGPGWLQGYWEEEKVAA